MINTWTNRDMTWTVPGRPPVDGQGHSPKGVSPVPLKVRVTKECASGKTRDMLLTVDERLSGQASW
jgi:hypothetical protein